MMLEYEDKDMGTVFDLPVEELCCQFYIIMHGTIFVYEVGMCEIHI